jgi:hypothetical protein
MKTRLPMIYKQESMGQWRVKLMVTAGGRYVVHLSCIGEPSWTRGLFFSSLPLAEAKYYEWRDERVRHMALVAFGLEPEPRA